jgi:serine/threonine protein kinase
MSVKGPSDDELPPTLVIDHLVGLSFDETITPSTHERLSGARERARVQALPQIVDDSSRSNADFTPFEEIAVGGIGVVELAHQRSVGRDVAIKRVRDPSVPGAAAMLLEEGRVMGLLEHPGIIPVLAMGRDGNGHPVLVMKRVEGTTWRALLRDPSNAAWNDFPGDRLEFHLRVLAQVADVAHFAHLRGWLHRDIKPENVMVGPRGEVYLIDWGLAVQFPAVASEETRGLVGTPGYMAPEMLQGVGPWLSPKTDVYLLGAVLHEVLTGRLRHEGASLRAVLASAWLSIRHDYPPSTSEELASLANEATGARPEARPASALVFKQRVEAFLSHRVALGMIEKGRERFAQLRSSAHEGSVNDEVELIQRLDGCIALLRRSLELWPGNPRAIDDLSEVLTWRIRRSLAHGDLLAARTTLADLPRPNPLLDTELARAAARIERERARAPGPVGLARRLESLSIAPARAIAAQAGALLSGGAMVALGATVRGGVVPFAWSTLAVASTAALAVMVTASMRGPERDVVVEGVGLRELGWIAGGALALTLAGRLLGLSPGQSLALLPILAGVGAGLLSERLGPSRSRLVAVCAVSALLAPAVLRWDATYLIDLMGLTTIAGCLLHARSTQPAVGVPAATATSPVVSN